jgi:adenylate cyclase
LAERFSVAMNSIFRFTFSRHGDIEPAFALLERLLPHANDENKAWIKHDSDFDPLREHPRYQKIVELIG